MPYNVTEYVPAAGALTVSIVDAELPGVRVTLEGLRDAPRPEVCVVVKVTLPVSNIPGKPFCDVAVMLAVAVVYAGTGPRLDRLLERATDA